jgi:hypothetical protein
MALLLRCFPLEVLLSLNIYVPNSKPPQARFEAHTLIFITARVWEWQPGSSVPKARFRASSSIEVAGLVFVVGF